MSLSLNTVWPPLVRQVLMHGNIVTPRGKRTREIEHHVIRVDMRRPVLTVPSRGLSFKGAAAEAHWIVTGDGSLQGIEPWLPRMKEFSDNGVTLFGAYGPRIASQLDYVVAQLRTDGETRRATLTLWERNPPATKDYPCTVAMDFKIRRGKLQMHVFMRSSDVWLGVPYDVFSFSMVAHLICCRLNDPSSTPSALPPVTIEPGTLFLTAASSHLYEENWLQALAIDDQGDLSTYPTPESLFTDEQRLLTRLRMLRTTGKGDRLRWWESGE